MERIFEIKFLVPPIFISFVAILLNPNIIDLLVKMNTAQLIGSGSIVLLAVGTLISSISESIIKIFHLRDWRFSDIGETKINNIIPKADFINRTNRVELANWIILDELNKKYKNLYTQIHKRWYWTVANLNLFIALLLSLILLSLPDFKSAPCYVVVGWIIAIPGFFLLFLSNYKSVSTMHEALVVNKEILLKGTMKENILKIKIKQPLYRVFDTTINPNFTPKWIDNVLEEKAEYPIKVGTIYKNRGKDGIWNEYIVSDFEEFKKFELKSLNSPYVVRYTYERISENETELTYHEWMIEGELAEPFEMRHLEKLKEILEK